MADQKTVQLALTLSKYLREFKDLQATLERDQKGERSATAANPDRIREIMQEYQNYNFGGPPVSRTHTVSDRPLIALKRAVEDLQRVTLEGADLSGADLRGIVLPQTFLRHADFRGADLANADLSGTDLCEANFSLLDLNDDMSGASLLDATLEGANLGKAVLDHANFSRTKMAKANLHNSSLFHTLFIGADLRKASFGAAKFAWTNLRDAEMTGATIEIYPTFLGDDEVRLKLLESRSQIDGAILPNGRHVTK